MLRPGQARPPEGGKDTRSYVCALNGEEHM